MSVEPQTPTPMMFPQYLKGEHRRERVDNVLNNDSHGVRENREDECDECRKRVVNSGDYSIKRNSYER